MDNISSKYNISQQIKKSNNIEKFLKNSDIKGIPNVGSFVKTSVEDIAKEINGLNETLSIKLQNCKTEDEMKTAAKDVESKMQQLKFKANVYIQRGNSAIKLDEKLPQFARDPEKSKILDKIDIDKITKQLTEPAEDVDVGDIENNDDTDVNKKEQAKDEKFDEALKNDKITNVITSLINYIDKGEKNPILNDYIKEYKTTEQTNLFSSNMASNNNNLFTAALSSPSSTNPYFAEKKSFFT